MTTKKSTLRAVTDDEVVTPTKPLTVTQAAKSGSHRALLVSMRDRIADAVTNKDCPPRDLASLTKRLQDIANEIEAIDARAEDEAPGRLRDLESALRELDPEHPLLTGMIDDRFDASAI
ncbi:hypothetical protein FNU77_24095 [Prescottella equi]|uniref:hypothetical protein n=1 Tax=Rhodococcus hoagii TaxID=43767 RepID=UPI00116252D3|nr:hypothetical protein [Prescottella equi]QDP12575.1 hypothetical protein FNU77_24095 [Prescottella equi]